MAKKTPAKEGSSGTKKRRRTTVSRKVIGKKTSAPYERKAGEEGEDDKKGTGRDDPKAKADDDLKAKFDDDPKAKADNAPKAKADDDKTTASAFGAGKPDAGGDEPAQAATPAEAAVAEEPEAPAALPDFDATAEFADLLPPPAIQTWDPNAEAPPPAKAPPGDSRSFRRRGESGEEFVLIYRSDSYLIKRAGLVGRMGTWTVQEYPHIGAAAHAYAQECSELMGAGYRDLR
ncbi:hypothetical protein [Haliangium sp.]|uniref:hypothetical protein n=1 Tax=Haliangium sp. TaxID=2663208 RepID=UPI003D0EBDF2